jgi:hypothetical protein
MSEWQPIALAPDNEVVMTKIDDENGTRNEQALKRRGRLWFFPDGRMYVYYTPTHWMPLPGTQREQSAIDRLERKR